MRQLLRVRVPPCPPFVQGSRSSFTGARLAQKFGRQVPPSAPYYLLSLTY